MVETARSETRAGLPSWSDEDWHPTTISHCSQCIVGRKSAAVSPPKSSSILFQFQSLPACLDFAKTEKRKEASYLALMLGFAAIVGQRIPDLEP